MVNFYFYYYYYYIYIYIYKYKKIAVNPKNTKIYCFTGQTGTASVRD